MHNDGYRNEAYGMETSGMGTQSSDETMHQYHQSSRSYQPANPYIRHFSGGWRVLFWELVTVIVCAILCVILNSIGDYRQQKEWEQRQYGTASVADRNSEPSLPQREVAHTGNDRTMMAGAFSSSLFSLGGEPAQLVDCSTIPMHVSMQIEYRDMPQCGTCWSELG